jgi:hypothetical protein
MPDPGAPPFEIAPAKSAVATERLVEDTWLVLPLGPKGWAFAHAAVSSWSRSGLMRGPVGVP